MKKWFIKYVIVGIIFAIILGIVSYFRGFEDTVLVALTVIIALEVADHPE